MSIQLFEIIFDDAAANPCAVYRTGQVVSFRVRLVLREPVKCKAIYVKQFGNSYVDWSARINDRTRHFSSEEIYINQKVVIFSPETSGPNAGRHPPGEFYYPGSFQVPDKAPSSYEGGIGRIRYSVKASIDRPPMADSYTEKFFTVIRDLDLNDKPLELVGPSCMEGDFEIKCCCQASTWCQSLNRCFGKPQGKISLTKTGYVPGEQVRVIGELHNTTNTDLYSVKLEIYQKSIFHDTDGRTNTINRVVSSVEAPGVSKGGGTLQLNYLIPVGPLPNSHLEGCSNIEVFYYLRIEGEGGCCESMNRECELIIGTIPLWSSYDSTVSSLPQQQSSPQPMQGAFDRPVMGAVSSQSEPQRQPPPSTYTYSECMFGRVAMDKGEGENFNGIAPWAPSYPVYIMASGQSSVPGAATFDGGTTGIVA